MNVDEQWTVEVTNFKFNVPSQIHKHGYLHFRTSENPDFHFKISEFSAVIKLADKSGYPDNRSCHRIECHGHQVSTNDSVSHLDRVPSVVFMLLNVC